MKLPDRKLFLQILASGILYGISFPPLNLSILIFFSFVILLEIIYKSESFKNVFFRSYFVFLTSGLAGVSWIALSGLTEGADPFLVIGGIVILLIYPLFFVIPSVLFYFIKNNFKRKSITLSLLVFPFLWTGFEYLSSLGQISFPWLFAGNSQTVHLQKIQYAEFTGVFGVSFWICLISVCIYFLYLNLRAKIQENKSLKTFLISVIILIIYFLPDFYNYVSTSEKKFAENSSGGKVKIGIIQPDVNPWKKWGGKQADLINSYADDIKILHSENPDVRMVILPETAFPYYFRENIFESKYRIIKDLCDSLKLPVLAGTPDLQKYKNQSEAPVDAKIMKSTGEKYDTYNSAFLFEPGKEKDDFQKHYKIKLVAGSERMPYQEIMPFTKNLIEWGVGLGSWQIGNDTNLFILDGKYKFNTAICYESVYPEFFAEFVNKGADFSVIITNDGWWGKLAGTYQHNQFAVLRAVENRIWIARCANTGISDFIDPYGNMFDKTEINQKTHIVREIGLKSGKTFYTEHGDVFSKICLITALLVFSISFFVNNRKNL